MRTETYLAQIEKLECEVLNKIPEQTRLFDIATQISVQLKDVNVQTSGDKDKIGNAVASICDIGNEIISMLNQRKKIVGQIQSMQDKDEYDVLAKVFILGKSIKVIAIEKKMSEKQITRIRNEAMNKFEEIYGNEYLEK